MHIDAILLITTTLAILVILAEDSWFQGIVPRTVGVGAGMFAFGQAMWLLGVWVPGASGFPVPRIGYDGAICALAVTRAIVVVKQSVMLRRMSARRHEAAIR